MPFTYLCQGLAIWTPVSYFPSCLSQAMCMPLLPYPSLLKACHYFHLHILCSEQVFEYQMALIKWDGKVCVSCTSSIHLAWTCLYQKGKKKKKRKRFSISEHGNVTCCKF